MKQFIYLDNDIINSIIAQKDNGLIKDIKTENSSIFDQKEENVIDADIDGKIEGGLFKIAKAEAKLSLGAKLGKEEDVTNTTREILEKTMHDATFDIAYDYIKAKKIEIGNNLNDDYGEYVELKRVFDFVDLDYVEGLFSNKEFDNISNIINDFRKMIPYNRMLISNDGYLIPLDEKYFRVNPSSIGFMYGGDITCVGMITNIIGKDTNPNDDKNIFATLQFSINEALISILPTN